MASILDEYELNIDHFEEMVGTGASIKNLQTIFNCSRHDLEVFCKENYNGASLDITWTRIRELAYRKYLQIMKHHAEERAVTSATDMVERFVWEKQKEDTVKIVFAGTVSAESEEDKLTDPEPDIEPETETETEDTINNGIK